MNGQRRNVRHWSLAAALGLLLPLTAAAAPKAAPMPDPPAIDGPGLKSAIQQNRGKVVLVNLWATWCQPCVEEFPSLVKLYNTYKGRGLVVLAMSMDELKTQEKVAPFLARQKAKFPAYIRKPGEVEAFIDSIDKDWTGAIPVTYLYDRDGKQVGKPLVGGQTYAAFTAAIEPLLKQADADRK
jgi:thiol-disulfide isomerase/thioredoxin